MILSSLFGLLNINCFAGTFSSPRDYWKSCNSGSKPAADCGDVNSLKRMCSLPKNQADCAEVSNFYSALSRQVEAKNGLSVFWVAERTIQAETSAFSSDLWALKESFPVGKEQRYVFGVPFPCQVKKQQTTLDYPGISFHPMLIANKKLILAEFAKLPAGKSCPMKGTGFLIMAVGFPGEKAETDVWIMDDKKQLENIKPVKLPFQ